MADSVTVFITVIKKVRTGAAYMCQSNHYNGYTKTRMRISVIDA